MKYIIFIAAAVIFAGIFYYFKSARAAFPAKNPEIPMPLERFQNLKEIYFAGGCFWDVQALFDKSGS